MTVWILVVISFGAYNAGTTTVVDRFPDVKQCEHVLKNIRAITDRVEGRCIQATIVRTP